MEAQLLPTKREDIPPAPLVQLTMTIQEFAVFEALRYGHLNGFSSLRTGIETAADEAVANLDPYWEQRIRDARTSTPHTIIEQVERAFNA